MNIQLEGIKEVERNMQMVVSNLDKSIKTSVQIMGEIAIEKLKEIYKDAEITGLFFPDNNEYWINVNDLVVCQLTGRLIDTAKERAVGRNRGAGETSWDRVVLEFALQDIMDEVYNKLNQSVVEALK